MIGGPNDLVIESEIIRAESRDSRAVRDARVRDKEVREKEQRESPPVPAGVSWPYPAEAASLNPAQRNQMPASRAAKGEPEAAPESSVEESKRILAPQIAGPATRPPVFPMPSRRPPQVSLSGQKTTAQREPLQGRSDQPPMREVGTTSAKGSSGAPAPSAFLRVSLQRARQGTPTRPASSSWAGGAHLAGLDPASSQYQKAAPGLETGVPVGALATPGPLAAAPAPQGSAPLASPMQTAGDTLEEEMARLLGRGSG
jgi:flagellar protein FliO/FliZ